ncbi:MAG: TetR/AcrR family transcriptional regulator [Sporichthyaceae bacterium]|nr:TetR/AcrR family transcriptional regulator [Sporichthyaceae bacterium]
MPEPTTSRGRDSKSRIVAAAAGLMYERGIRAASVDDIVEASGTGKSQFYHYFPDKSALVAEVLAHQLDQILDEQKGYPLDSFSGIATWFRALVERHETRWGLHGCPLGSIAGEAADHGESLRVTAADVFTRWESSLATALEAMRHRGELTDTADAQITAEAVIAIIQGGYLLSSIKRDVRPMRGALQAAILYLESYSPTRGPHVRRGTESNTLWT